MARTDPDAEGHPTLALESFLPYRLARAAEEVSQRFARLYRQRYGLSRPEWRTLATVGQYGAITATAIGRHSAMHKTKVSRAVQALEQRRWVMRRTDEHDRRVEHITLTAEGRDNYRDLVTIARRFEQDFTRRLGAAATAKLSAGLTAIEAIAELGDAAAGRREQMGEEQ